MFEKITKEVLFMEIKKYVSAWELKNELWSGALNTFNVIIENNKVEELMQLLSELFYETTDITTINDLLWFEPEYIYEALNITVAE